MESPPSRPPNAWLHELWPRFRTMWVGKMFGTTLGMVVFFVAYFYVLRHPRIPPTVMPLVAADRLIGFRPEALLLYVSLWFYVSLAPAFLTDRRELLSYGVAAVVMSVAGLAVFYLWPTVVPVATVDWTQHPHFAFLKSIDAAGNACPSLHVAFAVFTAAWFRRLLRQMGAGPVTRALNWLWCLGILYSTMAIRQHVALDVLAGGILGAVVAAAHLRWVRRSPAA